ncbi:hypothetical protein GQ42DRAFT_81059 [Ramicandelaber brevisporus]|nr:hypothetical protein GQ42DRAFT_81059 [Ramicandelaber brevisporus]
MSKLHINPSVFALLQQQSKSDVDLSLRIVKRLIRSSRTMTHQSAASALETTAPQLVDNLAHIIHKSMAAKNYPKAEYYFDQLAQHMDIFTPDNTSRNARLVSAFLRLAFARGDLRRVEMALDRINSSGMHSTVENYNVMINGFAQMGSYREAVALFDFMAGSDRMKNEQPDIVTYTLLMKCIGWHRQACIKKNGHPTEKDTDQLTSSVLCPNGEQLTPRVVFEAMVNMAESRNWTIDVPAWRASLSALATWADLDGIADTLDYVSSYPPYVANPRKLSKTKRGSILEQMMIQLLDYGMLNEANQVFLMVRSSPFFTLNRVTCNELIASFTNSGKFNQHAILVFEYMLNGPSIEPEQPSVSNQDTPNLPDDSLKKKSAESKEPFVTPNKYTLNKVMHAAVNIQRQDTIDLVRTVAERLSLPVPSLNHRYQRSF